MKRALTFAKSIGTLTARSSDGETVEIPIFPGILKHPAPEELPGILRIPEVLEKYTIEALRTAPWPLLREFPRVWLLQHISAAKIREGRLQALRHLLS